MRVWALVSQKGGSGKSTLATQIAVIASQNGETPIIVDMDPQGSAEVWCDVRGRNNAPGAIASTLDKLQTVIESARNLGVTLLIIDTPPHTDKAAVEAVNAAGLVVCPTQSSLFDVWALRDTVSILDLCKAKGKAVVVVNSLPTTGTKPAYDEAAIAVKQMDVRLAKTGVCHRKAFVASINAGKGVTEMFPKDKASEEIRTLWGELEKLDPVKKDKALKAKEKTQ